MLLILTFGYKYLKHFVLFNYVLLLHFKFKLCVCVSVRACTHAFVYSSAMLINVGVQGQFSGTVSSLPPCSSSVGTQVVMGAAGAILRA